MFQHVHLARRIKTKQNKGHFNDLYITSVLLILRPVGCSSQSTLRNKYFIYFCKLSPGLT